MAGSVRKAMQLVPGSTMHATTFYDVNATNPGLLPFLKQEKSRG